MTEETIVAIYDTQAHADAAISDLHAAGVPPASIVSHGSTSATSTTSTAPVRERGFWSGLFGGEPDHDTAVYDRSVENGSKVVTVQAPAEYVAQVSDILERHSPVDINERVAGYGLGARTPATAAVAPAAPAADTAYGSGEAVIALSEEQLAVGKRVVDRGTTRVRRFVVETPVEQAIRLRSEHVSVERRPVSGRVASTSPEFTDRVIEMSEIDEEAMVSKTARVAEEVVVRKQATERVETIRDTVRREEVEITRDGDRGTTSDVSRSGRPNT